MPETIRKRFSLLQTIEGINFGLFRMYVTPYVSYFLDKIYIRFGNTLYRQIVGIPMGTNFAPLVTDFILFCCERDVMTSLSDDNQADIIEAFNSTARYLEDLLNVDNPYFEEIVNHLST